MSLSMDKGRDMAVGYSKVERKRMPIRGTPLGSKGMPSEVQRSYMPIFLVLAARHPIFLDGLERLFRLQSGFRVVARCGDGAEAVAAVRRHRPDVLVLDTNVPPQSGLDVVRE